MEEVPDDSGRAVFDCVSAVVLLLTALLGAYLPRCLSRNGGEQSGTATSLAFHLGNMLSGGVMLSAGFCHLLADSIRQLAFIGRFPISTFLAAVGYLITLLADQLVQVLTADDTSSSAAVAAAAGGGGAVAGPAGPSSSSSYRYMRLGKDESSLVTGGGPTAVELVGTHHSQAQYDHNLEHNQPKINGHSTSVLELNRLGALPVATANNAHSPRHTGSGFILQSHDSSNDDLSGRLADCSTGGLLPVSYPPSAAAAVPAAVNGDSRHMVLPRLSLPGHSGSATAAAAPAAVNGPVADSSTPDDVAVCIFASGSPRGPTAGSVAARPSSRLAYTPAAAAAGPAVAVQQEIVAGRSGGCQCRMGTCDDSMHNSSDSCGGSDTVANEAFGCEQQQRPQHWHPEQQQRLLKGNIPSDHSSWRNGTTSIHIHDKYRHTGPVPNGCHPSQQQQQQQQERHVCCLHGDMCVQHPEDMTEAHSVARVAGHLELEIQQAGGHTHAHFQVLLSHQPLSFATTVLLACALCIHSILEGIALGAQQSMESTRDIMLAIAAHKGLAAYALGASIVESKASSTKFWTVVSMFAAATPLGIGIGYAFSNVGHGSVSAAMSALASGTFLYVALNEVIPKELEHPDGHRLLKVGALLLGFGLMSLLAIWA